MMSASDKLTSPREQVDVHRRQKVTRCDGARQRNGRAACRPALCRLCASWKDFREYYLLDGGPDVVITVSVFDSADAALISNAKAADWVRHNVLEFARGMPEIIVGDVLIAEVKEEPAG